MPRSLFATVAAVAAAPVAAVTAAATAITAVTATAATTAAESTAATAAAAETAPTAAKAASTRRTLLTRAGDVHGQGAALELVPMKFFHGLLRLFGAAHRDKGKTTRTSGELVEDDLNDADSADFAEQGFKVLRGAGEGEVPHVELGVF